MKLVSFSWEGSKPGHWAHWSQSHKESSLQEIQVAFLRYYTHLLLLRAGFPLPSFQQHGYPKALFSRSKRLKCYYKRRINKGTLISSFVFVFFRYYFIPPQNSLLLNCQLSWLVFQSKPFISLLCCVESIFWTHNSFSKLTVLLWAGWARWLFLSA